MAIVIVRSGLLPRWLGLFGILLAVGIAFGLTERAGFAPGGSINALTYVAWPQVGLCSEGA